MLSVSWFSFMAVVTSIVVPSFDLSFWDRGVSDISRLLCRVSLLRFSVESSGSYIPGPSFFLFTPLIQILNIK